MKIKLPGLIACCRLESHTYQPLVLSGPLLAIGATLLGSCGSLLQVSQVIENLTKENEEKHFHIDTILKQDVGEAHPAAEMSAQQEATFERDYAAAFEAALKKAISKKRLDEPMKK